MCLLRVPHPRVLQGKIRSEEQEERKGRICQRTSKVKVNESKKKGREPEARIAAK
jgi:hypothetical protein